jgi:cytosine/adenosine deaminase-related metal-dependent hydrolase
MSDAARSWFVRGGLVLDPADGIARRRDLVVRDGVIVENREPAPAGDDVAGMPVHDASDALIIPGLVNAHTHGHANLMKGVADRWPLEVSLTHGPWLSGPRDLEAVYCSTLLGAIEMIAKGCTSCYDLVYEFPRPTFAGIQTVARAYADAGMRAVIAPMIADRSLFDAIPDLVASLPAPLAARVQAFRLAPVDETFGVLHELIAARDSLPEGITLGIAPTIPLHCSDAFMLRCAEVARGAALPMHMHLAESRLQATTALRVYGRSLTAHVARLGLLDARFTAAHAVWLDAADGELLAAAGAAVAHVPASNFRLGSGIARIRALLDRGVAVGLATDGANSSDSLDLFLAMRLASFASRAFAGASEDWLTSRDVFRAATIGGAAILGAADSFGRPAAGYAADLAFLDLHHPAFVPLNDPLEQIVNGDAAAAVTDVMRGGRFVMRERHVAAWTPALRERVADATASLRGASGDARELADLLAPNVARFVADHADDPLSIERQVRDGRRRQWETSA